MTPSSNVPAKFYQVCRICLTEVSDTSDLINLSVFGRNQCHQPHSHLSSPVNLVEAEEIVVPVTPSAIASDVNHTASVIVKNQNESINRTAKNRSRKSSNATIGGGHSGSDDEISADSRSNQNENADSIGANDDEHLNKVHNNNNNEMNRETGDSINASSTATAAASKPAFGNRSGAQNQRASVNASSTNYKIDGGDDSSHLDLLNRIYTFLAISVSRFNFQI